MLEALIGHVYIAMLLACFVSMELNAATEASSLQRLAQYEQTIQTSFHEVERASLVRVAGAWQDAVYT